MAFSRNLHHLKEVPMNKKYIVRLTDEERAICEATVKNEKGKSEKLRRAMVLLKADADGPGWNDEKISEAVGCRTRTVENVRQEFGRGRVRGGPGSQEAGNAAHAQAFGRGRRGEADRAYGWGSRLRGTDIGRCGCWPINWSSWKSWIPSAPKPSGRRLKKRDDEAEDRILGDPSRRRR